MKNDEPIQFKIPLRNKGFEMLICSTFNLLVSKRQIYIHIYLSNQYIYYVCVYEDIFVFMNQTETTAAETVIGQSSHWTVDQRLMPLLFQNLERLTTAQPETMLSSLLASKCD